MKTKLFAIFSTLSILLTGLLNACGSKDNVKDAAMAHFSTIYDIEGTTKIDTVIFLNASIPQLLSEDDNLDYKMSKAGKDIGGALFMLGLAKSYTDRYENNKDELNEILYEAFHPWKTITDSLDKIKTPKQNLALVQVTTADSTKKASTSKYIYVLGDDVENPISDSIIVNKKLRERVEISAFVSLNQDEMLNATTSELDSIMKDKVKNPVLKFIVM